MNTNKYKNELLLLKLLKENKNQYKTLLKSINHLDISLEYDDLFLGFLSAYKYLSEKLCFEYTIIDIGCAYNFQSEFFRDFRNYIAVDTCDYIWKSKNTIYYKMKGQDFFKNIFNTLKLDKYFIICNYVPDYNLQNYIKLNYKNNSYVYYP